MKKKITMMFFLCLILLVACSQATDSKGFTGKVVYVVDGDTIDVKLANGKEERIRMLLVDTPETKHPTKPVQPFGPEASAFTKKTLLHQQVQLELDVSERDQYGRLLAYVYLNGKMYNETLLEEGLARVVVYASNTKYVDEFKAIQKKAQEKEIGIWSLENYRTEEKKQAENEEKIPNQKCKIKGNINSRGEKIYHTPDSPSYKQTKPENGFVPKTKQKLPALEHQNRNGKANTAPSLVIIIYIQEQRLLVVV
ncbi:thermonuclease family protein [Cytobacillus sp. Hz8]|uniref:thermonuclease family protein n=1 Tax=Cytobacillus sp. Hz8 TaxID=3347168 RepID=UPI0035DFF632